MWTTPILLPFCSITFSCIRCPAIPIHPACQDAENEFVKSFRKIAEQLFAAIVLHIGRFCINLSFAKSIATI